MNGWICPHCGKAHGPDVITCPEPSNRSLGERMREANGIPEPSIRNLRPTDQLKTL